MDSPKPTKLIAGRIDIRYIDRPSWFRWWRRWVAALTLIGVLIWLLTVVMGRGWGKGNERMFNPGPLALAHARVENNCTACHTGDNPGKPEFSKRVTDSACLSCHDAGAHHPQALLHPGQAKVAGVQQLIDLSDKHQA